MRQRNIGYFSSTIVSLDKTDLRVPRVADIDQPCGQGHICLLSALTSGMRISALFQPRQDKIYAGITACIVCSKALIF